MGRITYEQMAAHWPTATDDYAPLMNSIPKVVGGGKANVLASSGGAVTSLELVVRHGDRIAILVPHEIPCAAVMSDPAKARAEMIDITASYKTGGLARMLGSEPAVFPGAHDGFESHAPAFARKLREVFEA